jgi:hypothetical protein
MYGVCTGSSKGAGLAIPEIISSQFFQLLPSGGQTPLRGAGDKCSSGSVEISGVELGGKVMKVDLGIGNS